MKYKNYDVTLELGQYGNGNMAIQMFDVNDGMPVAVCTVNVQEVNLADDEVLIKNYSENTGMLEWFKEQGLVDEVEGYVNNGFVSIPKVKLNMDKLKEYTDM